MCKKVTFFGSADVLKNMEAGELLNELEIEIEDAGLLLYMGRAFKLPYIHTDDGYRFCGIDDIRRFVQTQKEKQRQLRF